MGQSLIREPRQAGRFKDILTATITGTLDSAQTPIDFGDGRDTPLAISSTALYVGGERVLTDGDDFLLNLSAADGAVAIGSTLTGNALDFGTTVGTSAKSGLYGTAFGRGAEAGSYGIANGYLSSALEGGVAIGQGADASTEGNAIGRNASADIYAVANGAGADAGASSVCIGYGSTTATYGTAVGQAADAETYGVAFGYNAKAKTGFINILASNGSTRIHGDSVGHICMTLGTDATFADTTADPGEEAVSAIPRGMWCVSGNASYCYINANIGGSLKRAVIPW
jgi:hypothetical protein